jgi:hypothetical protein
MAQTGYTPISIYYSATSTNVPTAGNLVAGELAINTADGKLFYKDSAGVVQVIGTKGGVGSSTTTQVLYNSSGLVVGSANMTFNGTTLTLANDASISGLTVGKGGGSLNTNTALGLNALLNNSTGQGLVGIGRGALQANTSGQSNIAIGGTYNTDPSLFRNTTGSFLTAVGEGSLANNTTASNNTAVGYQSLYSNTTGNQSVALGYQAGFSMATNFNLTAIGFQSLQNATGNNNTAVGQYSGNALTSGANNTFIGQNSGSAITTGGKNSLIGNYSGNQGGLDIRTASNYIVLSDGDGNPRLIGDNVGNVLIGTAVSTGTPASGMVLVPGASGQTGIYLGHASGTSSGAFYAGFCYNSSTIGSISQTGTTAVLYNTTSDYRLKNDVAPIQNALAIVEALNPVSFTWIDGRKDDGFLAHEIQAIIPNCVTGEKDAVNEDGTPKYQQMDNSGVIPFLVKAIQELNAKVIALEAQLGAK